MYYKLNKDSNGNMYWDTRKGNSFTLGKIGPPAPKNKERYTLRVLLKKC